MPNETRRINRLVLQFVQDGHLSLGQKWRSLWIEIFGDEGLIPGSHLTKRTAYCDIFNIEIFRLHKNTEKYPIPLAKRKSRNPFKWIEFIVSLLEFLPWFFHRSARNTMLYLRDKKSRDSSDYFFIFCFLLLILICIPLNIAVHLILGVVKRILAPARYIIRPSIELYKEYSALFTLMLLITVALTTLLAWNLLTGNLALVIGGIALTATLSTQMAVVGLAAVVLWVALLKVYGIFSDLYDISQNFCLPKDKILKDKKVHREPWTSQPSKQWHGLNAQYTDMREPNKQDRLYSAALFFGVESAFYPAQPIKIPLVNHSRKTSATKPPIFS